MIMDDKQLPSYLNYLPSVYQTDNAESFIGHYLKVFEKILTGLDDEQLQSRKGLGQLLAPDVIGQLFYPRFSFLFAADNTEFIPPIAKNSALLKEFNSYLGVADSSAEDFSEQFQAWLGQFLDWLGGWLALELDASWDVDKKRQVLAKILPIYRIRGTLAGLQQLLDLFFKQPQAAKQAALTVKVERAADVPALQVGINTVLTDRYQADTPLLQGQRPWLFSVKIYLPDYDPKVSLSRQDTLNYLNTLKKIKAVIAKAKPEFSDYQLKIYPTIELGKRATLGENTVLGCAPETAVA
jgi:phage tail-like protein